MKKRFYRTLIIVIMTTILFGISACSNDSSETISTKSESTKESTTEQKKENETASIKKKNEEKSEKEEAKKEEAKKSESESKSKEESKKESESKETSKAESSTKAADTKETKTDSSNKTAESTTASAPTTTKTDNNNKTTAPTQTTTPAATPAPVHTHSYSSSVTQNPSCSAQGVRSYVCSCGNSYTESIPATEHSWTPRYETIHHEAQGEMRQVQVGTSGEMYKCAYCGGMFSSHEEIRTHWQSYIGTDNSHARTNYLVYPGSPIYENQWIETQAAYDEQVAVGYVCNVCGATK